MANAPTISVDIVAAFGAFKEQLDQASKATKDFADGVKGSLGELTAPFGIGTLETARDGDS
jgi:hypothetical protein